MNPEGLSLTPITAMQCCLYLEKHLMKIRTNGQNPTSRQVLFLSRCGLSEISKSCLRNMDIQLLWKKSDVLTLDAQACLANSGLKLNCSFLLRNSVLCCPHPACLPSPTSFPSTPWLWRAIPKKEQPTHLFPKRVPGLQQLLYY